MAKSEKLLSRQMNEDDWNEILASIEREECILVLGPGAVLDKEGNSLHDRLCELFAKEVGSEVPESPEKLFQLADLLTEKRGWRKLISDLTQQAFEYKEFNDLYPKLTRIPFHLVMSVSPDMMLKDAFEQNGIPHHFDYYNYKEKHDLPFTPSKTEPLLYNLFGKLDDEDSLVLTNESLFDFIFSILSAKSFPQIIKENILSAYNFLYLGFDFESWYLKILMRLFESHKKEISYAHVWQGKNLNPSTKNFFERTFKIDFVSQDVGNFVKDLFERCEKEGILREAAEGHQPVSDYKKVTDMIKAEKIDEAIDFLENHADEIDDTDLMREVISISRRYNGLVSEKIKKTISPDDAELRTNQIVDGLLQIAEILKDEE